MPRARRRGAVALRARSALGMLRGLGDGGARRARARSRAPPPRRPRSSSISSELMRRARRSPTPTSRPRPSSSSATSGSGRREEAEQVAAALRERAADEGRSRGRWRGRCAAEGWSPPTQAFDRAFEQALEHHAQTPDVFETARTRLAYGERLRRARNRVLAREQLRAAAGQRSSGSARGRGPSAPAPSWRRPARRFAAAIRAPSTSSRPRSSRSRCCSPRARRRARPRRPLFLSPKTVEYHLRHVYLKLDIHSREELAVALAKQAG